MNTAELSRPIRAAARTARRTSSVASRYESSVTRARTPGSFPCSKHVNRAHCPASCPRGRGPKHSERTWRWRGFSPSWTAYTGPSARQGEQGQPLDGGFDWRRRPAAATRRRWGSEARITCGGSRMNSGAAPDGALGAAGAGAAGTRALDASSWRVKRAAATNARQPTTTAETATIGRAMRGAPASGVPLADPPVFPTDRPPGDSGKGGGARSRQWRPPPRG